MWRISSSLIPRARPSSFGRKLGVLRSRIPVWRGMLLAKLGSGSQAAQSESRLLGQIWQTNDRAVWDYSPQPYPGKITDFRPAKQYRIFNQRDAKWDRLAKGGQEIIILPVYPAGMLLEPFVKHLADALRKSIDAAIGQCETELTGRNDCEDLVTRSGRLAHGTELV